jgi:hypothetical protein
MQVKKKRLAEMIKMFSHLVIILIPVTGKKSHVHESSKNECNLPQQAIKFDNYNHLQRACYNQH